MIMNALFLLLTVPSLSAAPLPPYKRVAALVVDDPTSISIDAGVAYLGYWGHCDAFDLQGMRKLWSLKLPGAQEMVGDLRVVGSELVVCTSSDLRGTKSRLDGFSLSTRKRRWSVARKGAVTPIAFDASCLYVGMSGGHLSALDRKTHKARWTISLPPAKNSSDDIQSILVSDGRVVVNSGAQTAGYVAATGKKLWADDESYMFRRNPVIAAGVVWAPQGNGSVARDLKTGTLLWKSVDIHLGDFGGGFAGGFVGSRRGSVVLLEPRTGKVRWSHELSDPEVSGGSQYAQSVGSMLFVRGAKSAAIYDPKGKSLWTGDSDGATEPPCWSNAQALVTFGGTRFTRYEHGTVVKIPTDPAGRRALATKLVGQWDKLDDAETKQLISLGDDAFEPLLKAFLAACDAYDAKKGHDDYPLYSKYHALGETLAKVTTAGRGKELVGVLRSAKKESSAKPAIMTLVAQFGDPDEVVPLFLKELEGFATPGFEMYESNTYVARSYIIQSKHPLAVKFMLAQISNPKGDYTLREEAYWHLAGTAGEAGLKAVLAERHKRTLLRPLAERMELEKAAVHKDKTPDPETVVLAEKKDAQGRTWGLLQCGVLASRGDLWIAEKVDGKWKDPLFLGVSLEGVSRWVKPPVPEPKVAGKTAKELADGAWFALVGNGEIRKDTDADGLTDLVEKRLGTDASKADTDGDGDSDAVDPWPNAAPRATTEAEKVMEAVFEARYHFTGSTGPGLISAPSGAKPFEMVGRDGPVMWEVPGSATWSSELSHCYEQGVAMLGFRGGHQEAPKSWDDVLEWNKDRTEAQVTISTYYGGLAGDGYSAVVRKFGNDWVVVEMRMAYVS